MNNNINLFKSAYKFSIRNIPSRIREKFDAIKMMIQRAKYGVSDWDAKELGDYLDAVIYNGLKKYVENEEKYFEVHPEVKEFEEELLSYFRDASSLDYEEAEEEINSICDIMSNFEEHQAYRSSQRYEGMQQLLKYWEDLWL